MSSVAARSLLCLQRLHNASVKHEEFQAGNFDVLILDEAGQVEDMKLFYPGAAAT